MGFSKHHSSTVGLTLNQTTGSVTPQFHVVFDDHFATVSADGEADYKKFLELLITPGAHLEVPLDPKHNIESSNEWLTPTEREARDAQRRQLATQRLPQQPQPSGEREIIPQQQATPEAPPLPDAGSTTTTTTVQPPVQPAPQQLPTPTATETPQPATPAPAAPLHRSSRQRTQTTLCDPSMGGPDRLWRDKAVAKMAVMMEKSPLSDDSKTKIFANLAQFDDEVASSRHTPLCLKSKPKGDPDTPNCFEAMSGPHCAQFKDAMDEELEGPVKRQTWTLVP